MNDEAMLTLHCPKCKQITDVVQEGNNLVCLDCGWRFDDKVAANFLSQPSSAQPEAPAKPRA